MAIAPLFLYLWKAQLCYVCGGSEDWVRIKLNANEYIIGIGEDTQVETLIVYYLTVFKKR